MSFGWGCRDAEDDRFISFDVVTMAGELLGEEDLPFELDRNGSYTLPDLP